MPEAPRAQRVWPWLSPRSISHRKAASYLRKTLPVELAANRQPGRIYFGREFAGLTGVMSLIRLSEHRPIESAARTEPSLLPTLATVLYVASTFRTGPRQIDHYIDYFGD